MSLEVLKVGAVKHRLLAWALPELPGFIGKIRRTTRQVDGKLFNVYRQDATIYSHTGLINNH